MRPLRLQDIEQTVEVDAALEAMREGRPAGDWVRPYSANGKHCTVSRRDPARPTDV